MEEAIKKLREIITAQNDTIESLIDLIVDLEERNKEFEKQLKIPSPSNH